MKLGYEVIISNGYDPLVNYHGHGRVMIEVRQAPDETIYIPERVWAMFTWVTQDEERYRLSQFECRIVAMDVLDLNESAVAARRVMKAVDDISVSQTHPVHILDALDKIKAIETVMDWRYPKRVPVANLLSSEYKCWYDDIQEEEGCGRYSCVKLTEEDARASILAQAASMHRLDKDWIARFIEAEMPVSFSTSHERPDPTPARKRLQDANLLGGNDA